MKKFADFLAKIDDPDHLERMEEVLTWVSTQFPNLKPKIAWNQPMFTDHDTFIIGFSISKQHMAVAPERVVIDQFSKEIVEAGYDHTKELSGNMRWITRYLKSSSLLIYWIRKIVQLSGGDKKIVMLELRRSGQRTY